MYIATVSGRLPEHSDILNISTPHLSKSSNSCETELDAIFKKVLNLIIIAADKFHTQDDFDAHFGQQILPVGADAKARDAGGSNAGAVCGFLHATDLRHGPLLLLLLLAWGGHNIHVMLLLCNTDTFLSLHVN